MDIWRNILLIALVCVIVIDISGFIESTEQWLGRLLGYKVRIPKPFSCSLCSTWWAGIIYSVFTHCFSLEVLAYIGLISVLTPVISDAVWTVREFLGFVVAWINTWFRQ